MLIKTLEDENLNESFESEGSHEEPRRASRESDVHRDIVEVLVSCLDYRTPGPDNLVLWTYLTESLKYLYFKYAEVSTFVVALFKERMGWWSKQAFRNETLCTDEVIIKKAIICLMLHGSGGQRYKAISENIEERKKSDNASYFVNLAKELDLVVCRVNSPLLPSITRPIYDNKKEMKEEWAKIKIIKSAMESNGHTQNTQSSIKLKKNIRPKKGNKPIRPGAQVTTNKK